MKRNASKEEVKSAFVALSKKYHPDLNPRSGNAREMIVEINEAYSVLSKPLKRHQYNSELHIVETYQAQFVNEHSAGNSPIYAGSGRRTRSSYSAANPHTSDNSFSGSFTEIDWEAHKRAMAAKKRPKHFRVIRYLIFLMVISTTVIFSAHKHYQEKREGESKKNYIVYSEVREKARRMSVHEQLEVLSKRHSETVQRLALEDSRKS